MNKGKATWNFEKDKMLIELVKNKPGLYNLHSPYYSDNNYKKMVWDKIGKTIGRQDVKTRWESLRSQYRKYLSKLKTKSGQAAAKIGKWRYYDQMLFLNKFLNSDIPSIQDMEIFSEEREESNERDLNDSQNGDDNQVENNESVNIFGNTHKRKSKPCNTTKEITATTLMKYLLQKKEQETLHHPIDNFFSLMATTVKTFSPIDQHYVKTKVFALVTEIEEKYLMKSSTHVSTPPQMSPTPSLPSTSSSSSSSSNHTEMPVIISPEVSIHSPTQCTPTYLSNSIAST